jgi:phosphoglycerate dehydrogenase-like enzyme
MNILIGVISRAAAWVMPRRFVDGLRSAFPQHTFLDAWDRPTIDAFLPDVDAAFTPFVDRDRFQSATRLRWVQVPAVGVDSLLYPAMVESEVVITNARGVRARAMAEHVLGVIIALARHFHTAVRHQVAHIWAQDQLEGPDTTLIRTLQGSRLGIVGLGSIGMEVARLAAAFGLRVSAVRRRTDMPAPDGIDEVLPPERLDELLVTSDVVVLAAPLTAATHAMIGRHELTVMKQDALLINIGRGALVDDDALVEALRGGRIGGAALDVFPKEPLSPESPYWDLSNVLITPHTSGAMADYWTPLVGLFSENLRRFQSGLPLLNVVDKRLGY